LKNNIALDHFYKENPEIPEFSKILNTQLTIVFFVKIYKKDCGFFRSYFIGNFQ